MNQTKKELSYFRLKLEGYLRDHHPELMPNSAFIELVQTWPFPPTATA